MIDSVRVTVRLFAGLRERAGTSRLEVDGVTRVGDVWAKLGLGDEPGGLLYAVNREYAGPGDALHDGDEVARDPAGFRRRVPSQRSYARSRRRGRGGLERRGRRRRDVRRHGATKLTRT